MSRNFVLQEKIYLTDCDREAIHIPDSIQRQGTILILQESRVIVVQTPTNS